MLSSYRLVSLPFLPSQAPQPYFQVHVNRFWPAVQLVSLSLSQMFYRLQGYSFLEYTYVIFLSPFFPTTFNHPMAAGFNENFESQQIIPN